MRELDFPRRIILQLLLEAPEPARLLARAACDGASREAVMLHHPHLLLAPSWITTLTQVLDGKYQAFLTDQPVLQW